STRIMEPTPAAGSPASREKAAPGCDWRATKRKRVFAVEAKQENQPSGCRKRTRHRKPLPRARWSTRNSLSKAYRFRADSVADTNSDSATLSSTGNRMGAYGRFTQGPERRGIPGDHPDKDINCCGDMTTIEKSQSTARKGIELLLGQVWSGT